MNRTEFLQQWGKNINTVGRIYHKKIWLGKTTVFLFFTWSLERVFNLISLNKQFDG